MDETTWIVIAAAAVVVLLAVLITAAVMRRRYRDRLRDRFGPEYDRTVGAVGRRRAAERDLAQRAERRDRLDLRPIDEGERRRLRGEWVGVQAEFVDDPMRATIDAERVVDDAMRARGYPVDGFAGQADLISVDHPDVVEHYRRAHQCGIRARDGEASTEEARQAVLAYRRVLDAVVEAGAERRHEEPAGQR